VTPDTGTPRTVSAPSPKSSPHRVPRLNSATNRSRTLASPVYGTLFLTWPSLVGFRPQHLEDDENAPVAIRYALHATATFVSPVQAPSTSYFACFASPITHSLFPSWFPPSRTMRAKRCDVEIARVMAPTNSPIPFVPYTVDSNINDEDIAGKIPSDVLSKIVITASVPEYVDMESNPFELRLRMRACGLEALHCKRLRLTNFMVDVLQFEKYRLISLYLHNLAIF
jgi:hypothetical protein